MPNNDICWKECRTSLGAGTLFSGACRLGRLNMRFVLANRINCVTKPSSHWTISGVNPQVVSTRFSGIGGWAESTHCMPGGGSRYVPALRWGWAGGHRQFRTSVWANSRFLTHLCYAMLFPCLQQTFLPPVYGCVTILWVSAVRFIADQVESPDTGCGTVLVSILHIFVVPRALCHSAPFRFALKTL